MIRDEINLGIAETSDVHDIFHHARRCFATDSDDLKIVPVEVERVAVAGFIVKDQRKRSQCHADCARTCNCQELPPAQHSSSIGSKTDLYGNGLHVAIFHSVPNGVKQESCKLRRWCGLSSTMCQCTFPGMTTPPVES